MWGVVMLEICLVCGFALLDIYLVIDTKRKLKERENACNIVLNNAKLKSDNYSIDDVVKSLKDTKSKITYSCLKEV